MSGKIYVTGDCGEDLFTRSDKGGRQTTHSAADIAYDFPVRRGASFVQCVLKKLLSEEVQLLPEKVLNTVQKANGRVTGEDGGDEIAALEGMLTHIKQYPGNAYRVWHMDRLVKEDQPKQKCSFFWKKPSPSDLLVIHHGGANWSGSALRGFKPFLKKITQSSTQENKLPPIIVNVKELPEVVPGVNMRWQFSSPLWQSLCEFGSKVSIVVAMSTLRRSGAAISLGFSWERTIEDFAAELHLFPKLEALSEYFPHLFVRVGVAGIIHIEREGSSRRGTLYFMSDTLEAFERDPEMVGRVIGKNSLLIAFLARARKREQALRDAFGNVLNALRNFLDKGYSVNVLEKIKEIIEQSKNKYHTGEELIKKSLEKIEEEYFQPTEDPLGRCSEKPIEQYLLDKPLPNTLRSAKRWRMLDDALHKAPVHRINIAMAIVIAGHKSILNAPLTKEALDKVNKDLWPILNRADYWNPHDRAPDYVTQVEGEHPSPPLLDRGDFPLIPPPNNKDKLDELIAPVLQFGGKMKLVVAEREEIEGLCSVSRLLKYYIREKEHCRKPISIAVFGPPGTGKSFAIKRIAETLDEKVEILEFNVAQFKDIKELGVGLTRVGSLNHQGKTPLVFFDEFDCVLDGQPLGWLKYFLAPMQDGSFYEANQTIEIGRAIFVFAGGTYPSFELFDPRTIAVPSEEHGLEVSREHKDRVKAFAERKGPDFISRLRGHINISQINNDAGHVKHLIRRALVLRSMIVEQHYCHPHNGEDGRAMIDEEVIYALLTVDRYRHGVRSMEAILQMSKPIDGCIHIASLPSPAQLNMHVDAEEFLVRLYRGRTRKEFGAFALGNADDAKAMLDKTIAALNADKAKTLDEINDAKNGFLQGDIYPFCFNLSDGNVIAVASPSVKKFIGKDIRMVHDTTGDDFGARMYAAAKAGEVNEVSYKFPIPGSETPVSKVIFLTAVAGLGCGVGYYK